jgi:hypothetical protein
MRKRFALQALHRVRERRHYQQIRPANDRLLHFMAQLPPRSAWWRKLFDVEVVASLVVRK